MVIFLKPKVYIVNKSGHDFSDAERFGDLVFMTRGTINRYAVNVIFREFNQYLKDSKPEDFIIVTGMSTMLCVVSAIFAAKHHRLNLLLYKNGRYLERSLIFDENGESKNAEA